MVAKKKASGKSAKLKLKKETIKDLQPRGKAIKGGALGVLSVAACAARPKTQFLRASAAPTYCETCAG